MHFTSFVVIVLLTLLSQHAKPISACLECFVGEKMENFPQWVLDNNLDPSQPNSEIKRFSKSNLILRLETEIRNMTMQGFSRIISPRYVYPDLSNGFFAIEFNQVYGEVVIEGIHSTNGTILAQTPLYGEGKCRIITNYLSLSSFEVYFEITSSGFLNLTGAYLTDIYLSLDNTEIYFENVSDNNAVVGYEQYVHEVLFEGMREVLTYERDTPIHAALTKFWQEELAKTTLADIIGSTGLPPTSIQPTDPATTETPRPTSSTDWPTESTSLEPCCPCKNAETDQVAEEAQVVSDDVVETYEDIDENGVAVIYTKRVVLTKQIKEL